MTASPLPRSPRFSVGISALLFALVCLLWAAAPATAEEASEAGAHDGGLADLPRGIDEARSRARWMAELVNGSLQIMHRDFFDIDNPDVLPSQSLEDVFREMERSWSVEIRWLGVNATKARKHRAADDFEKAAVSALRAGAPEYEAIEGERYRFVKSMRIQNECLKCHVPYRTSLEDRVGGIAFAFPFLAEPLSPAAEVEVRSEAPGTDSSNEGRSVAPQKNDAGG